MAASKLTMVCETSVDLLTDTCLKLELEGETRTELFRTHLCGGTHQVLKRKEGSKSRDAVAEAECE